MRIVGVWDAPEEARRVGEEIERLEREGASLEQVAILVRAQYQTADFEERFIKIGLSYRILGGRRFWDRAHSRDLLAYLRLLAQPRDDLAFERIINVPKRGLGDKAQARIQQHARLREICLFDAASELAGTDELTPQASRSLSTFVENFVSWRAMLDSVEISEVFEAVMEDSGYGEMLKQDKSVEAAGRAEDLAQVPRLMQEYDDLDTFLEHIALVTSADETANHEAVTIMTMHAAKGLEFDHVFLPGWEEGVFPSQRSLDEGGLASLEEERRLAYVAITRARRRCTILHAANRRIYGQWTSSIPSRFIEELPEDHIEQETTMTGGKSLWQANWSEQDDPFAHVARDKPARSQQRGPGWQRALATGYETRPARLKESTRSAASFAAKPREDVAIGARVFHEKFGYGEVIGQEGNKLEIDFEKAGTKRVIDSFVKLA